MADMTVSDVTMHWPLNPPLSLEPIRLGANNRSWLVMSGERSYVLKWYRNAGMTERLRFEHELLSMLARSGLPFAVPSPLPTRGGATSVEITRSGGTSRLALFHCIPGHAAVFGNRSDAYRCGEALAVLDDSLGSVMLNPAIPVPDAFSTLSSVHPSVPQPLPAIRQMFGGDASSLALASIVSRVEERWQGETSGWTPQLIHGDFYPANTLLDSGDVSGILDFEFSGMGHRAMDFSTGLAAFSTRNWDNGCSWPFVDAFATGYLQRSPLTEVELAATPTLLLMREATSLIHWLGRMVQGLTTLDEMHDRAQRLLSLHRWLEAYDQELVNRILRLASSS